MAAILRRNGALWGKVNPQRLRFVRAHVSKSDFIALSFAHTVDRLSRVVPRVTSQSEEGSVLHLRRPGLECVRHTPANKRRTQMVDVTATTPFHPCDQPRRHDSVELEGILGLPRLQ